MPNQYPFPASPTVNLATPIPTGLNAQASRTKANDAWALAFSGILNLSANSALLNIIYLGAGRFVGSDETEGQPTSGTGLTLRQPNASLLVEGRGFVVANPEPSPYQVITGITPNKSDGVEVFVGISPDTGLLITKSEWQLDALPVTDEEKALVAGLLHLGRAETSASTVTGFEPSTIEGRGVIRPRGVTSGGSGGGGEETPTSIYVGQTPYLYLSDDERPLKAVLEAMQQQISDFQAQVANADSDFPTNFDQGFDEIAINRAAAAEVNPHSIERGQISVVVQQAGHGQDDTPDYTPTTGDANELDFNPDDGTFGA